MKDLKLHLVALKIREIDLKKLLDNYFSNENEFYLFIDENKAFLNELKEVKKEIKNIEWQLMSDDEKSRHLKYLEDLKSKFNDEEAD
jgi:hypothetical protein